MGVAAASEPQRSAVRGARCGARSKRGASPPEPCLPAWGRGRVTVANSPSRTAGREEGYCGRITDDGQTEQGGVGSARATNRTRREGCHCRVPRTGVPRGSAGRGSRSFRGRPRSDRGDGRDARNDARSAGRGGEDSRVSGGRSKADLQNKPRSDKDLGASNGAVREASGTRRAGVRAGAPEAAARRASDTLPRRRPGPGPMPSRGSIQSAPRIVTAVKPAVASRSTTATASECTTPSRASSTSCGSGSIAAARASAARTSSRLAQVEGPTR